MNNHNNQNYYNNHTSSISLVNTQNNTPVLRSSLSNLALSSSATNRSISLPTINNNNDTHVTINNSQPRHQQPSFGINNSPASSKFNVSLDAPYNNLTRHQTQFHIDKLLLDRKIETLMYNENKSREDILVLEKVSFRDIRRLQIRIAGLSMPPSLMSSRSGSADEESHNFCNNNNNSNQHHHQQEILSELVFGKMFPARITDFEVNNNNHHHNNTFTTKTSNNSSASLFSPSHNSHVSFCGRDENDDDFSEGGDHAVIASQQQLHESLRLARLKKQNESSSFSRINTNNNENIRNANTLTNRSFAMRKAQLILDEAHNRARIANNADSEWEFYIKNLSAVDRTERLTRRAMFSQLEIDGRMLMRGSTHWNEEETKNSVSQVVVPQNANNNVNHSHQSLNQSQHQFNLVIDHHDDKNDNIDSWRVSNRSPVPSTSSLTINQNGNPPPRPSSSQFLDVPARNMSVSNSSSHHHHHHHSIISRNNQTKLSPKISFIASTINGGENTNEDEDDDDDDVDNEVFTHRPSNLSSTLNSRTTNNNNTITQRKRAVVTPIPEPLHLLADETESHSNQYNNPLPGARSTSSNSSSTSSSSPPPPTDDEDDELIELFTLIYSHLGKRIQQGRNFITIHEEIERNEFVDRFALHKESRSDYNFLKSAAAAEEKSVNFAAYHEKEEEKERVSIIGAWMKMTIQIARAFANKSFKDASRIGLESAESDDRRSLEDRLFLEHDELIERAFLDTECTRPRILAMLRQEAIYDRSARKRWREFGDSTSMEERDERGKLLRDFMTNHFTMMEQSLRRVITRDEIEERKKVASSMKDDEGRLLLPRDEENISQRQILLSKEQTISRISILLCEEEECESASRHHRQESCFLILQRHFRNEIEQESFDFDESEIRSENIEQNQKFEFMEISKRAKIEQEEVDSRFSLNFSKNFEEEVVTERNSNNNKTNNNNNNTQPPTQKAVEDSPHHHDDGNRETGKKEDPNRQQQQQCLIESSQLLQIEHDETVDRSKIQNQHDVQFSFEIAVPSKLLSLQSSENNERRAMEQQQDSEFWSRMQFPTRFQLVVAHQEPCERNKIESENSKKINSFDNFINIISVLRNEKSLRQQNRDSEEISFMHSLLEPKQREEIDLDQKLFTCQISDPSFEKLHIENDDCFVRDVLLRQEERTRDQLKKAYKSESDELRSIIDQQHKQERATLEQEEIEIFYLHLELHQFVIFESILRMFISEKFGALLRELRSLAFEETNRIENSTLCLSEEKSRASIENTELLNHTLITIFNHQREIFLLWESESEVRKSVEITEKINRREIVTNQENHERIEILVRAEAEEFENMTSGEKFNKLILECSSREGEQRKKLEQDESALVATDREKFVAQVQDQLKHEHQQQIHHLETDDEASDRESIIVEEQQSRIQNIVSSFTQASQLLQQQDASRKLILREETCARITVSKSQIEQITIISSTLISSAQQFEFNFELVKTFTQIGDVIVSNEAIQAEESLSRNNNISQNEFVDFESLRRDFIQQTRTETLVSVLSSRFLRETTLLRRFEKEVSSKETNERREISSREFAIRSGLLSLFRDQSALLEREESARNNIQEESQRNLRSLTNFAILLCSKEEAFFRNEIIALRQEKRDRQHVLEKEKQRIEDALQLEEIEKQHQQLLRQIQNKINDCLADEENHRRDIHVSREIHFRSHISSPSILLQQEMNNRNSIHRQQIFESITSIALPLLQNHIEPNRRLLIENIHDFDLEMKSSTKKSLIQVAQFRSTLGDEQRRILLEEKERQARRDHVIDAERKEWRKMDMNSKLRFAIDAEKLTRRDEGDSRIEVQDHEAESRRSLERISLLLNQMHAKEQQRRQDKDSKYLPPPPDYRNRNNKNDASYSPNNKNRDIDAEVPPSPSNRRSTVLLCSSAEIFDSPFRQRQEDEEDRLRILLEWISLQLEEIDSREEELRQELNADEECSRYEIWQELIRSKKEMNEIQRIQQEKRQQKISRQNQENGKDFSSIEKSEREHRDWIENQQTSDFGSNVESEFLLMLSSLRVASATLSREIISRTRNCRDEISSRELWKKAEISGRFKIFLHDVEQKQEKPLRQQVEMEEDVIFLFNLGKNEFLHRQETGERIDMIRNEDEIRQEIRNGYSRLERILQQKQHFAEIDAPNDRLEVEKHESSSREHLESLMTLGIEEHDRRRENFVVNERREFVTTIYFPFKFAIVTQLEMEERKEVVAQKESLEFAEMQLAFFTTTNILENLEKSKSLVLHSKEPDARSEIERGEEDEMKQFHLLRIQELKKICISNEEVLRKEVETTCQSSSLELESRLLHILHEQESDRTKLAELETHSFDEIKQDGNLRLQKIVLNDMMREIEQTEELAGRDEIAVQEGLRRKNDCEEFELRTSEIGNRNTIESEASWRLSQLDQSRKCQEEESLDRETITDESRKNLEVKIRDRHVELSQILSQNQLIRNDDRDIDELSTPSEKGEKTNNMKVNSNDNNAQNKSEIPAQKETSSDNNNENPTAPDQNSSPLPASPQQQQKINDDDDIDELSTPSERSNNKKIVDDGNNIHNEQSRDATPAQKQTPSNNQHQNAADQNRSPSPTSTQQQVKAANDDGFKNEDEPHHQDQSSVRQNEREESELSTPRQNENDANDAPKQQNDEAKPSPKTAPNEDENVGKTQSENEQPRRLETSPSIANKGNDIENDRQVNPTTSQQQEPKSTREENVLPSSPTAQPQQQQAETNINEQEQESDGIDELSTPSAKGEKTNNMKINSNDSGARNKSEIPAQSETSSKNNNENATSPDQNRSPLPASPQQQQKINDDDDIDELPTPSERSDNKKIANDGNNIHNEPSLDATPAQKQTPSNNQHQNAADQNRSPSPTSTQQQVKAANNDDFKNEDEPHHQKQSLAQQNEREESELSTPRQNETDANDGQKQQKDEAKPSPKTAPNEDESVGKKQSDNLEPRRLEASPSSANKGNDIENDRQVNPTTSQQQEPKSTHHDNVQPASPTAQPQQQQAETNINEQEQESDGIDELSTPSEKGEKTNNMKINSNDSGARNKSEIPAQSETSSKNNNENATSPDQNRSPLPASPQQQQKINDDDDIDELSTPSERSNNKKIVDDGSKNRNEQSLDATPAQNQTTSSNQRQNAADQNRSPSPTSTPQQVKAASNDDFKNEDEPHHQKQSSVQQTEREESELSTPRQNENDATPKSRRQLQEQTEEDCDFLELESKEIDGRETVLFDEMFERKHHLEEFVASSSFIRVTSPSPRQGANPNHQESAPASPLNSTFRRLQGATDQQITCDQESGDRSVVERQEENAFGQISSSLLLGSSKIQLLATIQHREVSHRQRIDAEEKRERSNSCGTLKKISHDDDNNLMREETPSPPNEDDDGDDYDNNDNNNNFKPRQHQEKHNQEEKDLSDISELSTPRNGEGRKPTKALLFVGSHPEPHNRSDVEADEKPVNTILQQSTDVFEKIQAKKFHMKNSTSSNDQQQHQQEGSNDDEDVDSVAEKMDPQNKSTIPSHLLELELDELGLRELLEDSEETIRCALSDWSASIVDTHRARRLRSAILQLERQQDEDRRMLMEDEKTNRCACESSNEKVVAFFEASGRSELRFFHNHHRNANHENNNNNNNNNNNHVGQEPTASLHQDDVEDDENYQRQTVSLRSSQQSQSLIPFPKSGPVTLHRNIATEESSAAVVWILASILGARWAASRKMLIIAEGQASTLLFHSAELALNLHRRYAAFRAAMEMFFQESKDAVSGAVVLTMFGKSARNNDDDDNGDDDFDREIQGQNNNNKNDGAQQDIDFVNNWPSYQKQQRLQILDSGARVLYTNQVFERAIELFGEMEKNRRIDLAKKCIAGIQNLRTKFQRKAERKMLRELKRRNGQAVTTEITTNIDDVVDSISIQSDEAYYYHSPSSNIIDQAIIVPPPPSDSESLPGPTPRPERILQIRRNNNQQRLLEKYKNEIPIQIYEPKYSRNNDDNNNNNVDEDEDEQFVNFYLQRQQQELERRKQLHHRFLEKREQRKQDSHDGETTKQPGEKDRDPNDVSSTTPFNNNNNNNRRDSFIASSSFFIPSGDFVNQSAANRNNGNKIRRPSDTTTTTTMLSSKSPFTKNTTRSTPPPSSTANNNNANRRTSTTPLSASKISPIPNQKSSFSSSVPHLFGQHQKELSTRPKKFGLVFSDGTLLHHHHHGTNKKNGKNNKFLNDTIDYEEKHEYGCLRVLVSKPPSYPKIRVGDFILSINGNRVSTHEDAEKMLKSKLKEFNFWNSFLIDRAKKMPASRNNNGNDDDDNNSDEYEDNQLSSMRRNRKVETNIFKTEKNDEKSSRSAKNANGRDDDDDEDFGFVQEPDPIEFEILRLHCDKEEEIIKVQVTPS